MFHCIPSCPGIVLSSVSTMVDDGMMLLVPVDTTVKFDNSMLPMVHAPVAWKAVQLALMAQVTPKSELMDAVQKRTKETIPFLNVFMKTPIVL